MPEPKMDTKTLEMSIKADEAAVRFLRKTLSDKKSMVKSYEKTVKWLIKKGAGAHYKTKNHKKQCTRDIPAKKNRPDSGVSRRGILVP